MSDYSLNEKAAEVSTDFFNNSKTDDANLKEFSANDVQETISITHQGGSLKRTFSTYSVICIGFGLTNSWLGISASLITGIQSGGPLMIIYGILIVVVISYCIGITLSELSSAIPSAGGQYVWSRVLAPKKYSSFLAYLCGSLAWAGSLFTSASMALSIAQELMAFWVLAHPDHVVHKWQLFVIYQLINAFLVIFNCYGKWLPYLGNGVLYVSIVSYITITITVLVCSRGNYQDASFVFTKFDNNTGWSSAGIAFIVGLINPNWSFSCLDSACHLAEETTKPRTDIPKAILSTVTIGFVTAFTYSIAMFFCIRNLQDIFDNSTGLPILDIYYQALGNKAGALTLGALVFATACGCTISCHTWQTRLCWSFARDNGLPFSKYLAIVDPKLGVPLNAHLFSSFLVGLLGLLYLASDAAFNSMVVGCITFLLLSYLVPTISLLYRGRDNIKHGPFWLGKFGMFCNYVTIAWSIFACIFFSFPSFMPVTANTMNYVSAVIAVYLIWALAYWFFPIKSWSCREYFAGGLHNNEEVEFPDVCLTDL
ncbi:predicted protein [Scheffersomyces stipitis CBS 6054]|uniref:Choline transport protein n=1 Tax=Scheffersomyces stipitis (strain ATCC 58785 / CBS 6054 / NBRC 10063 / NRRL Y-11545) TaxID=322104 RepID=A3LN16_PICST|nr:predicted protein [Scheffersomyces stipitis CBS 6054]ABN64781.2 predicted protein [Scheffersomyces stipitis CBS 6054]